MMFCAFNKTRWQTVKDGVFLRVVERSVRYVCINQRVWEKRRLKGKLSLCVAKLTRRAECVDRSALSITKVSSAHDWEGRVTKRWLHTTNEQYY